MRRLVVVLIAAAMLVSVLMAPASAAGSAVPETTTVPQPAEGWKESYLNFLEENFDIFAALWPEGVGGMGFADLDLDGTPELIVFDQGASAALGAQLFDLVDGQVYCVSSTLDSAGGAFDDKYLSSEGVCANFFDDFRLCRTDAGWYFWVDSSNGTMETSWNEIVRFDNVDGVLTPVSVCERRFEIDIGTGAVVSEQYEVSGAKTDSAGYDAAANVYLDGQDTGYDAVGVFQWDDPDRYETITHGGFMALARDAAAAYVPIVDAVTLVSMEQ